MSQPAEAVDPRPHDARKPFVACTPMTLEDFDTAPVRFRFVQELDCTPAQLFEVFEDPGSWPRWAQGIGHVEWTSDQPYGPGTTRTVTFWGGVRVYEDFFLYDPPREMAFCFYGTTEEIWRCFGEHYTVDDLGGGRCRITWRVSYQPIGGFARVHPIIKPIMRLNLRSYLWRLARYVRKNVR